MRFDSIITDGTAPSMINVFLDFETFYSSEVGLSGMTAIEYVKHDEFEVIGAGIAIDAGPVRWVVGAKKIAKVFAKLDWARVRLICHNAAFDGTVLKEAFGYIPREYYCTMMASRPHLVPFCQSMSLDAVSKHLGIQAKGTFAANKAKGKHLADFTEKELEEYGDYCIIDTENCRSVYEATVPRLNDDEQRLLHLTVRKAIVPQLKLQLPLLRTGLEDEIIRKQLILQKAGIAREDIMSNQKFAAALAAVGATAPTKISPTTGKQTLALSKQDLEFTAMLDHPNEVVATLVEARLGAKSTIEESRLERFIAIGECNDGWVPFPLLYYGAHTGRMGGYDKINFQNLPRKSVLRKAVVAPPGYKLVVSDLSQIEARMVAWLAGQEDMMYDFRAGIDIYSKFGTKTFHKLVSKETPAERFVAKTAVLSLMYASGAQKFHDTIKLSKQAELSLPMAEQVVGNYRATYSRIPALWKQYDRALAALVAGDATTFSKGVQFGFEGGVPCVRIPEGRVLYFPELYVDGNKEYRYRGNKGEWKKIYGGAMLENISQAMSQLFIRGTELRIAEASKFRITAAGQVHDELIYCVPENAAERFAGILTREMTRAPEWAPEFPLACETKIVDCYADAK